MDEKIKVNVVGYFKIESGAAMISDPCYDRGVWCQGILKNVKNGIWKASAITSDKGRFGNRVAALVATLNGTGIEEVSKLHVAEFEVGVDSGQAGIFDDSHYQDDMQGKEIVYGDPWYSMCCDVTLNHPQKAGAIPFGCVSRSGYGDGGYTCLYYTNHESEIVRIIIDYGILDSLDMKCC